MENSLLSLVVVMGGCFFVLAALASFFVGQMDTLKLSVPLALFGWFGVAFLTTMIGNELSSLERGSFSFAGIALGFLVCLVFFAIGRYGGYIWPHGRRRDSYDA